MDRIAAETQHQLTSGRCAILDQPLKKQHIGKQPPHRGNKTHGDFDKLPHVHVLRRDYANTTDTTMFSVMSPSDVTSTNSAAHSARQTDLKNTSQSGSKVPDIGPPSWKKSKLNVMKYLREQMPFGRRRNALSMSVGQFRKILRKKMERGNWEAVRELIASYDFSDIPELVISASSRQLAQQKRENEAAMAILQDGESCVVGNISEIGTGAFPIPARHQDRDRRPSYGSRNGDRRSFTGKESVAAAAAIKAALIEESGESAGDDAEASTFGENVLHDICRYRPPPDVVESLLLSLRQHRRGCTSGKDDMGRMPLHVAAASGASPAVIEALARADPYPASVGDINARSPLHLLLRNFQSESFHFGAGIPSHGRKGIKKFETLTASRESQMKILFKSVSILKSYMLTYPGKVDFKDDDNSGLNPLDYAIDKNLMDEALIRALIRRRHPGRRSTYLSEASADTPIHKNSRDDRQRSRRVSSNESQESSDGQDINILRHLEDVEIQARKHRIQKIRAKRKEEHLNEALYDVFGIEEEPLPLAYPSPSVPKPCSNKSLRPTTSKVKEVEESPAMVHENSMQLLHQPSPSPEIETTHIKPQDEHIVQEMTEEDIINQHLLAYFEDHDDELIGDLQYCEEDDFDFSDPYSEETSVEREFLEQQEASRVARAHRIEYSHDWFAGGEGENIPPLFEITIVLRSESERECRRGDDSCCHSSNVSEVTSPDVSGSKN